jgi:hypothetical protein
LFLIGRFLKIFSSETAWPNDPKLDRDEMSNRNGELSIDASYQVLVHLAQRFQRRIIKKSANQKQESPVVAMFVNGSIG